jgi:hypothetical protein
MKRSAHRLLLKRSLCLWAALLLSTAGGCAAWFPVQEAPKGGIAETDETLKTPMRPAATQQPEKLPWYDMRNILDPRSRDIERHLGAY